MTPAVPDYEIYALRYATMARKRQEAFMAFDPHDGPFPIDYSVWVIRNSERTVLVDTGFSHEASVRRKRVRSGGGLARVPARSTRSFRRRSASRDASTTPSSVTSPVTYSAGVTSNAGFATGL